jgi:hypothetical protein
MATKTVIKHQVTKAANGYIITSVLDGNEAYKDLHIVQDNETDGSECIHSIHHEIFEEAIYHTLLDCIVPMDFNEDKVLTITIEENDPIKHQMPCPKARE